MWFAFNSGYYDLWLQPTYYFILANHCCDLLSILDITIFDYNESFCAMVVVSVVICFQFWILRSLITTVVVRFMCSWLLWFAFNSGYYDLWLQPKRGNKEKRTVVICFQFWILRSLITTVVKCSYIILMLWFAFNSGYYDLWLQHVIIKNEQAISCDLLSILDITIFDYNYTTSFKWDI